MFSFTYLVIFSSLVIFSGCDQKSVEVHFFIHAEARPDLGRMRATSGLVSRHFWASYEKVHFFIRVRYGLDPCQKRARTGPEAGQNRARSGLDPTYRNKK